MKRTSTEQETFDRLKSTLSTLPVLVYSENENHFNKDAKEPPPNMQEFWKLIKMHAIVHFLSDSTIVTQNILETVAILLPVR